MLFNVTTLLCVDLNEALHYTVNGLRLTSLQTSPKNAKEVSTSTGSAFHVNSINILSCMK